MLQEPRTRLRIRSWAPGSGAVDRHIDCDAFVKDTGACVNIYAFPNDRRGKVIKGNNRQSTQFKFCFDR